MDELFGLPTHPLFVHAVVVLVPLAVLGSLAAVAAPGWRVRFGAPVAALAVAAAVSAQLAIASGEELEDLVEPTALIRRHTGQGDLVTPAAVALVVAVVALLVLDRRRRTTAGEPRPAATWGLRVAAVAVVVASVASTGLVVRAGHSGARAVWKDSPTYRTHDD